MELNPQIQYELLTLVTISLSIIVCGSIVLYHTHFFPKKRKAFLIKEMGHCLNTREQIFGSELINHCRTILHNINLHSNMREGFKMIYTYGSHEIGVNWYPVNGLFEFTFPDKYETIAKIYYPT